jgi:hypothetical protein
MLLKQGQGTKADHMGGGIFMTCRFCHESYPNN